jgi:hypothetical protein
VFFFPCPFELHHFNYFREGAGARMVAYGPRKQVLRGGLASLGDQWTFGIVGELTSMMLHSPAPVVTEEIEA